MAILNKKERISAMRQIKDNTPTSDEHLVEWMKQNKAMLNKVFSKLGLTIDQGGDFWRPETHKHSGMTVDDVLKGYDYYNGSRHESLNLQAERGREKLQEKGEAGLLIAPCKKIMGPLASKLEFHTFGKKGAVSAEGSGDVSYDEVLNQLTSVLGEPTQGKRTLSFMGDNLAATLIDDDGTPLIHFYFK